MLLALTPREFCLNTRATGKITSVQPQHLTYPLKLEGLVVGICLLFFLLIRHSRRLKMSAPVQSVDIVVQAMASAKVTEEEMMLENEIVKVYEVPNTFRPNRFSHPSLTSKKGAILQFVSNNCNDAAGVIGAIRIDPEHPHDVQKYIEQHEQEIKSQAIDALEVHMKKNASHIGILEKDITIDDFACSFTVASADPDLNKINPNPREESGLWILTFPSLVKPIRVGYHMDSIPEMTVPILLINCYIHLNEASRRERPVRRKWLEQQAMEQQEQARLEQKRTDAADPDRSGGRQINLGPIGSPAANQTDPGPAQAQFNGHSNGQLQQPVGQPAMNLQQQRPTNRGFGFQDNGFQDQQNNYQFHYQSRPYPRRGRPYNRFAARDDYARRIAQEEINKLVPQQSNYQVNNQSHPGLGQPQQPISQHPWNTSGPIVSS